MLVFPWLVLAFVGLQVDEPAAAKPLIVGLAQPTGVVATADGKLFVTLAGTRGAGGAVHRVEGAGTVAIASDLKAPVGLAIHMQQLFVADGPRVCRITPQGKVDTVAMLPWAADQVPTDLTVDPESGAIYVASAGESGAAIHRILRDGKVTTVADRTKFPELKRPAGIRLDGATHLLVADPAAGIVVRINLSSGNHETVIKGLAGASGLAWDEFGRLYVSTGSQGRVYVVGRPGTDPRALPEKFSHAGAMVWDSTRRAVVLADPAAGTLTAVPLRHPEMVVDETPLPIQTVPAFSRITWTGWSNGSETGRLVPMRPIVLTNAGDGSRRVFMGTQHGVIHSFALDAADKPTTLFLDIQDRVRYHDSTNEEGLLGLAFHPRFKENGEFFVFYTPKPAKNINVVSRFRLRKDDPTRADPGSEQEILRFTKPFWNHDGGTIAFGPEGKLYITHGDGGLANDPYNNGQNLQSLLGKILRIDVDHPSDGKAYGIPSDNPLVAKAKDDPKRRPEIWAYGLRNVWRMDFDRATGRLWAADVGQNLYEEINLIERGGNYGWNLREGWHPFGAKGCGPRADLIDPIWEYHHDVGKSITGGLVYRGKRFPELVGMYLYADYVSGRIWALRYDDQARRVVANRPLKDRGLPILSFGADEDGEVYLLTVSADGRGIFELARVSP
jgi:glucose/arabinose dehydrogenase